ncbi:MAG TPA: hypothetical protein VM688_00300 [Nocardioidaceae bacterium]|jgi:hypothetical protein|nr:hypothetical protein [Nocardioidaceae bacterium]
MNVRRTAAALSATAAALTGLVLISPAANASGGTPDVRSSGTCTIGATWRLKAKPDDGRLSIEFEVDSNRVGQTWSVRLTDNRNPIYTGTRKTVAPSGSFTVAMLRRNLTGADTIRARAVNTVNGSVCGGRVVL